MQRAMASSDRLDASPPHPHHHVVALYEGDEYLVDSVCSFVEPALRGGDAVIVVATRAHRDGFVAELMARGIDLSAAGSSGRFLLL